MAKASPHYREAWEQVKKTLEKAGDGNPFNELVVHLAVTFIAGLAGGRVAEILEHLKQGIPLTEGLKELTIHATEMGIHFVMPKSAQADLADPASWVDASHAQIEVEQLAVGAMLEDAIKANNDNRAGFFRDVDVVGAVHGALTFNGQPMRTLDATPIPSAEEFEKTIWKGWLVGYRGIPDVNDADAWLKIMHRIDDLDEDGYDFVMKYAAAGGGRAAVRARRRQREGLAGPRAAVRPLPGGRRTGRRAGRRDLGGPRPHLHPPARQSAGAADRGRPAGGPGPGRARGLGRRGEAELRARRGVPGRPWAGPPAAAGPLLGPARTCSAPGGR